MTSHSPFPNLKREWNKRKFELLHEPYSPEELDSYRKREKPEEKKQEYRTPEIPLYPRFEGTWVVGLPGTGKTQLFQHFLMADLDMVARGEASVVIIDPTGTEDGTLTRNVPRLKRFAPGG